MDSQQPKLQWEPMFSNDPNDTVSTSANYMGVDFFVELQDDGRFALSSMIHGALYNFGATAIRQRAIAKMEKIFAEMLADPRNVMRIAEKHSKY